MAAHAGILPLVSRYFLAPNKDESWSRQGVVDTYKTTQASHDNAHSHSLRSSISFVDQFPSLFPLERSGERVVLSR